MKYLILFAIALLSACGQTESSVSSADLQQAEQTQAPTGQVLRVANEWAVIADGNYVILPTTDTQIDLLAKNHLLDTTIYAKRLPEKVDDIQAYANRLDNLLNHDSGYLNPQSQLSENSIRYQFSQENGGEKMHESCLLQIIEKTPYLACIYSTEQNFDVLNKQIHEIHTQP